MKKTLIFIYCCLLFLPAGCNNTNLLNDQENVSISAEENALSESVGATEEAIKARKTAEAKETGTAEAEQIASAQAVQDRISTYEAGIESTKVISTSQAESFFTQIDALFQEGDINRTGGRHIRLENFSESWAQIDWVSWWLTGYKVSDFVVSANVSWDSASESANEYSGCGFVFRESGVKNHYLVYLSMEGMVYMERVVNGNRTDLGSIYYGPVGHPSGKAKLMLAVEGSRLTVFVNDVKMLSTSDEELKSGKLAYTIYSGINTGYGTKCVFTNVDLWELQ